MTMTYTEIKQFNYSRFRGGGFPIIPFVYVHISISSDGLGTAWRIIPESKWLITMVIFSSPKGSGYVFPNCPLLAYKWG